MTDRKPNLMKCDKCGKVADFKDKYKPGQLFHRCNESMNALSQYGIWRYYCSSCDERAKEISELKQLIENMKARSKEKK